MSSRTGALYIRVSTDAQEELSPDAQKRLLLDYARKTISSFPTHLSLRRVFPAGTPRNVRSSSA